MGSAVMIGRDWPRYQALVPSLRQDRDFMLEKLRQTCNGQREFIARQAEQIRDLTKSLQDVSLSAQQQIHAVDVAHRAAEKDASAWQKQMELSHMQHQKQIQTVKARCRLLQAERDALTMALSAVAFELMGGSNASAADVKQSLEGATSAGEEPLHRSKTCWLQLKYAVDDEGTLKLFTHTPGSMSNPYNGDGARAVQVLLKQAARVLQQRKEADERACQAAALLFTRDDVIESFTQEHRVLLQLAEQFEGTALEVQQRRAIAGIVALSIAQLDLQYSMGVLSVAHVESRAVSLAAAVDSATSISSGAQTDCVILQGS
ncbi:TPA: hypothetical protein ACH3X1_012748 [Trebouxia sp. C0004]